MADARSESGSSCTTPHERIYERFLAYDAHPILIVGDSSLVGSLGPDARLYEPTLWDSFDRSDHPPGAFGGVFAPGLLEGYRRLPEAIAALKDVNLLLREGGILATDVRSYDPSVNGVFSVANTLEILARSGYDVEDLTIGAYPVPDEADLQLVMSILAKKQ
jgi:hypothetical protein